MMIRASRKTLKLLTMRDPGKPRAETLDHLNVLALDAEERR
jgi:hypothetical protein